MNRPNALASCLSILAILCATGARADDHWSRLWRNADQRGEQLLHQGKAADAAKTYRDPRRRAYAELAAGDYQAAAQGYAAFDDSESQYNRGNALAHSGDLKGALQAYDAALAKDPRNTDAKKNRDLVEKALQQQQQQQQQSQQNQSQQNRQQDSQKSEGQPQDQKQPSAGGQKPNDQTPSANKAASDQQHDSGAQDHAQNEAQNPQQNKQPAPASQQDTQANQQAEDKAQARQDAQEAARAAAQQQQQPQDAKPSKPVAAAQSATPKSEQQLAEEQWLRQIPDDPGGLLRRKFMIEHLMRQQQEQQK